MSVLKFFHVIHNMGLEVYICIYTAVVHLSFTSEQAIVRQIYMDPWNAPLVLRSVGHGEGFQQAVNMYIMVTRVSRTLSEGEDHTHSLRQFLEGEYRGQLQRSGSIEVNCRRS